MGRRFYYSATLVFLFHLALVFFSFRALGITLEPNSQPGPVLNLLVKVGENVLWLPLLTGWSDGIRRFHISIEILFVLLNSLLWGFVAAWIVSLLTRRSR